MLGLKLITQKSKYFFFSNAARVQQVNCELCLKFKVLSAADSHR